MNDRKLIRKNVYLEFLDDERVKVYKRYFYKKQNKEISSNYFLPVEIVQLRMLLFVDLPDLEPSFKNLNDPDESKVIVIQSNSKNLLEKYTCRNKNSETQIAKFKFDENIMFEVINRVKTDSRWNTENIWKIAELDSLASAILATILNNIDILGELLSNEY